jgi:hypothetical protein
MAFLKGLPGKDRNMKLFHLISMFLISLALQTPLFADVINPDYHPVNRCATIDNLDSFPDIVLIAAVYAPGKYILNQYVVKKDSCLAMGYKFNTLNIFWTTRDYFNEVGLTGVGIPQNLAKKSAAAGAVPVPAVLLTNAIVPYGGTVPNSDSLVGEEYHYLLIQINGSLMVYLAKKVSINSGQTKTTQNFDPPTSGVIRKPSRTITGPLAGTLVVSDGYALLTSAADGPAMVTFFNCAGRPVVSFSRNCRKGCTYIQPLTGLASGLYWMRLVTPGGTVSKQLPIIR